MKELFAGLKTISFNRYKTILAKIRETLETEHQPTIDVEDFAFLLRPYFWYLHNPGFQDIIDACERAMEVMQENKENLLEDTNPFMGNDFIAVGTFLANYLDIGAYNTSGWKMLIAGPEVATSVVAEKYAKKLTELGKPPERVQVFQTLSEVMKDIELAKHNAYWCLRIIGADHVKDLKIIHSLPPGHQAFILHALDGFAGNKQVIEFYQEFMKKTKYDFLIEAAKKYLKMVEGYK